LWGFSRGWARGLERTERGWSGPQAWQVLGRMRVGYTCLAPCCRPPTATVKRARSSSASTLFAPGTSGPPGSASPGEARQQRSWSGALRAYPGEEYARCA
jgi:hypothetical protein